MNLKLTMEKGTLQDLDELECLYNDLIDYLDGHVNYPGWKKDIYPAREDAEAGIKEGNLFVARTPEGKIAGTVILRHTPEEAYSKIDWNIDSDYSKILVVYTLAVHPDYLHKHVGSYIMEFILSYAQQTNMKAVRLDVVKDNIPAIRLYESCGFQHMGTIDLGYGEYGLDLFELYQKIL